MLWVPCRVSLAKRQLDLVIQSERLSIICFEIPFHVVFRPVGHFFHALVVTTQLLSRRGL